MAGQLSIQPPVLDLALYAGDGIKFKLICTDDADPPEPVNITGDIQAQIRVDRSTAGDPVATFSADMAGADIGEITLSLTGDETAELMNGTGVVKGKFTGVWDVQWTETGGEPRTLCQGKVECIADVTR
jgi:hypothetical protein